MRRTCTTFTLGLVIGAAALPNVAAADSAELSQWQELAEAVVIHRDRYGVPHIFGANDESVLFGFAFAQAEDYFWQIEDSYILALGRYSEAHGPAGLNSDLINRAFEIVSSSQREFDELDQATRRLCGAFVAGLNYYLSCHPHRRPRIIERFEPWHVLAYHRHLTLELCYRLTGLADSHLPRRNPRIWAATGSNAWAIGSQKTQSGGTMLLANPHMPWYGFAQLHEAHLRSLNEPAGRPWSFTGATFYGSPILALGHNHFLGWTLTTNEPDVADVWRVKFEHPSDRLKYRYGEGWRKAAEWRDVIRVRKPSGVGEREFTFRKTHHGPIVARESETVHLAVRISGLYESVPLRQALRMMKSRNLQDFRAALAMLQMPYMNVLYADGKANIYYLYAGHIPQRNPDFAWDKIVEGSDPRTDWLGVHQLDELPQIKNPSSGFLQNCNSAPFDSTDDWADDASHYPRYMMLDADVPRRRAERSLEILRTANQFTLDDLRQWAFDTRVYWAEQKLPEYAEHWQALADSDPQLAAEVEPYLQHLLSWDRRVTASSTAATLCTEWYELLYGSDYPGETMREPFVGKPALQLQALVTAAQKLESLHWDWKVAFGEVHRIQRQPFRADLVRLRFQDTRHSLPSSGGHGPMGVFFTQYYTPSLHVPGVMSQKRRYGVIGTSYLGAYEFTSEGVRSYSLVPYGSNGNPRSEHFFDQAALLSERRMKRVLFDEEEVIRTAVRSYHPGR